jgi:hypothetical protein
MGQIQSGINQIIGQVGILTHLNPKYQAKAAKRAKIAELEGQTKDIKAAGKVLIDDLKANIGKPNFKETAEFSMAKMDEAVARTEELFSVDPTPERYEKLKKGRALKADMDFIMQQLRERGQAKVEQRAKRRDFMKALGSEPVNFGSGTEGTVNELPKNLQKAIAAQYDKSQRKELMDKYYGK